MLKNISIKKLISTTHPIKQISKTPYVQSSSQKDNIKSRYDLTHLSPFDKPKIVIVGAGMAGLSAAQSLLVNGIQDITILEAAERYGGRIFTKRFGDVDCELGTTCMPDYSMTPMTKNISYYNSSGKAISDSIAMMTMAEFQKLQSELAKGNPTDASLYDALVKKIRENVQSMPRKQRPAAVRTYCGILNSMRLQFGADLSNVNLRLCKTKPIQPQTNVPQAGCIECLHPIVKALPKNVLQLGAPVGKIEWKNTSTASNKLLCVHTLDGRKFPADFVICTFPIGVLKALSPDIFFPSLPSCKVQSTSAIGVGQVEKIFLKFSDPLSKWFRGPFKLAWTPSELTDRRHWNSGMCMVENVANSDRVLEVTVAGFQAEEMRLHNDNVVAAEVIKTLNKFQGSSAKPTAILRSNWARDTRFLGSLVYPSIQTNLSDILEQQQPLCSISSKPSEQFPRLLFAGDATADPEYFGTLYGAKISGIREAHRIIKYTAELNGIP